MNPMTSTEAQLEKYFLKHILSNPTKRVQYLYIEAQIGPQVYNTSQRYSAVKWGIHFTIRTGWNSKQGIIKT